MKKIFCMFVFLFIMISVVACDNSAGVVLNNMSDLRINYFIGNSDDYYVNLSCGYREEFFSYDGKSTNPKECGVLSLGFYESHAYSKIEAEVEIDGEKSKYVLEKSPFEDIFMVDIEKIITAKNKIAINLVGQTTSVELKEISQNWAIDYQKAIKIATNHFKEQIDELYFNGIFHAECYLKVLAKQGYKNIYWYFSIIDMSGKTQSVIIDVLSGEVLQENNN